MGAERSHFLRSEATGDAFSARFITVKFHRVDSLVNHVTTLGVDDEPGPQRLGGAQGAEKVQFQFEIEEVKLGGGGIEAATVGEFDPSFVVAMIPRQSGAGG